MNISERKIKLTKEVNELQTKLHKLNVFLGSDKTLGVPKIQLQMMAIQRNAMQAYLECLIVRIDYL